MPLFSWSSRIGDICASCKQIDTLSFALPLRLVSQLVPNHWTPPLHSLGASHATSQRPRSPSPLNLATTSHAVCPSVPLLHLAVVPESPSHWFSLPPSLVDFGSGRALRSSPCMPSPSKCGRVGIYLLAHFSIFFNCSNIHQALCPIRALSFSATCFFLQYNGFRLLLHKQISCSYNRDHVGV